MGNNFESALRSAHPVPKGDPGLPIETNKQQAHVASSDLKKQEARALPERAAALPVMQDPNRDFPGWEEKAGYGGGTAKSPVPLRPLLSDALSHAILKRAGAEQTLMDGTGHRQAREQHNETTRMLRFCLNLTAREMNVARIDLKCAEGHHLNRTRFLIFPACLCA